MPPLKGPAYIIGYLFQIGPVMGGGFGAVAITYGEIESWCRLSGISLAPWEARLLRHLSSEYAREAAQHSDRSPWSPELSEAELRAVASNLRAAIKQMAA